MPQWIFDAEDARRNGELFMQFNAEVLRRGLIVFSVCYPNFSHQSADIEAALAAMGEALEAMVGDGLFPVEKRAEL